jgi:hypothetical protein
MAEDESYLPASIQYSANWTGLASAIATALIRFGVILRKVWGGSRWRGATSG